MIDSINIDGIEIAENILKAAGQEDIFKAHQVGDIHPNGKWIWTEYAPGKFDWKSKNGKYHKQASKPSGGTDDHATEKTTQERKSTMSTAKSKHTVAGMHADLEVLNNFPDGKTKKMLADKYGISSNKMDEIKKEIYRQLNELHKDRTQYTFEDVKYFRWYWDSPSSAAKIKQVFEGESLEFLEFYTDTMIAELSAMKPSSRMSNRGKSLEREVKILHNLVNDRKNAADAGRVKLLKSLNRETKVFHDNYMKKVEEYHKMYFNRIKSMKDFHIGDYMSLFGVMLQSAYSALENRVRRGWAKPNESSMWYKYHSDYSTEYTTSENISNTVAQVVRVRANSTNGDRIPSSIPSDKALKYLSATQTMRAKYDFNETKYITDVKDEAERQYQANLALVADKVRKMSMDETKLSVKSISKSVKGFDIEVTDGKKKIYARSIFAAENSQYVSPHYRFIVTDRSGWK